MILSQSRPLRFFALFILYVAQGVPIGLFWSAIPAWMATNGASAADIGTVAFWTSVPWSIKFINGFIMDRYTFLPMGRRKVWIAGAQLVMIALLIACAFAEPQVNDVLLLAAASFAVNLAVTFQDVGIDGLAVDILGEDERARGSGMMFGGQAIGASMATIATGRAMAEFGPAGAYVLAAAIIFVITLFALTAKERPGEKRMPWSEGETHPRNSEIHLGAWVPIFVNTFKSLILPLSLLWVPVLVVRGLHYGVLVGVSPMLGANEVGWAQEMITDTDGWAQLVGGILGLTLGGWAGDKFGAKKTAIVFFCCYIAMSMFMWFAHEHWSNPDLFMSFVFVWRALDTLLTVACLPISMRLCNPRVAATQFTIYMAISNQGISLGALIFTYSEYLGGLRGMFAIIAAAHLLGLLLMIFVKFPRRQPDKAVTEQLAESEGPVPRIN